MRKQLCVVVGTFSDFLSFLLHMTSFAAGSRQKKVHQIVEFMMPYSKLSSSIELWNKKPGFPLWTGNLSDFM